MTNICTIEFLALQETGNGVHVQTTLFLSELLWQKSYIEKHIHT